MNSGVPVIDIAPFIGGERAARERVVRAVDAACSEIGFLAVRGHGVSETLVGAMQSICRQYFALPAAEKQQLRMPGDRYRGYSGVGQEALAQSLDAVTPPDLKEVFAIGPVDAPDDAYHRESNPPNCFAPNLWPARPAQFREIWEAYYREMSRLAATLMRMFACALELPETYFDRKIDRHITVLSAVHYPEQPSAPLQGQLRAGAHTDYGSLTILKLEDAAGGLQVQSKDGRWRDVPAIDGAFVVNLGDLMAEWTNDRWVSTMHRVANPPREHAASRRLSLVFFHQPNYDAVIECLPTCSRAGSAPRYGRITSGEHLFAKITKQRQSPTLESKGVQP